MRTIDLCVALPVLLASPALAADEIEIVTDDSLVAVITHKGGFAAKRAHNHLIAAAGYEASLHFEPSEPQASRFSLDFAVEQLAVDRWDLEQRWYPRLAELGILGEPFTEIADKDRQKIRKSMLGREQLDGGNFPRISARVTAVTAHPSTHGGVAFPYAATLVLEVRGRSVEKQVAARYQAADGALVIEALGSFRFSDFGIEPFSAFFGAVKNLDEFHVYLHLAAVRPSASAVDERAGGDEVEAGCARGGDDLRQDLEGLAVGMGDGDGAAPLAGGGP